MTFKICLIIMRCDEDSIEYFEHFKLVSEKPPVFNGVNKSPKPFCNFLSLTVVDGGRIDEINDLGPVGDVSQIPGHSDVEAEDHIIISIVLINPSLNFAEVMVIYLKRVLRKQSFQCINLKPYRAKRVNDNFIKYSFQLFYVFIDNWAFVNGQQIHLVFLGKDFTDVINTNFRAVNQRIRKTVRYY